MPTDVVDIKNQLLDISKNLDDLKPEDDKLITQIIKIERKHLHGLEGSSEKSRRDEIERLIKDRVTKPGAKK